LAYCGKCGSRMRGETRRSRGKEWMYMTCPVQDGRSSRPDGSTERCNSHRVPAIAAEAFMVDALLAAPLPDEVLALASEKIRRGLASPAPSATEAERKRLRTRLTKLADLYGWDSLTEAEYRAAKAEAEAALAALPTDSDRIVLFDPHRARVASLGDEMAEMTWEQVAEVFSLMVERVDTRDQRAVGVVLLPE
ncbi:MAG: zinc ribbon domain-containing protein, partial [Candidatus Limnocylindria bacterium]